MLTIITASHRNLVGLQRLASEILPVLSSQIAWIIKDSGHCGDSARWAVEVEQPGFRFDTAPDLGIYDALNQAVAVASVHGGYYLVAGSDDHLDGEALTRLGSKLAGADGAQSGDIITFPVATPKGVRRRKRFLPLWVSSSGLTSSHSIGTVIRCSLHDRLGPYDTTYRILADSLFLRLAYQRGAVFEHCDVPILGTFNLDGVSSRDHGRRLIETYSYLCQTGSSVPVQAALLFLRICRYRPSTLL